MISDPSNKSKVAVIAIGYNRLNSIRRLLYSLSKAHYPSDDIPLVISIDCGGNEELNQYVQDYQWDHGEKYVLFKQTRLGLREHILQCGDLTSFFRGVILLEDDIYVSESYYDYTLQALDYYGDDYRIAGISLHKNEVDGSVNLPRIFYSDGSDAFLMQTVASWGECWTESMWNGFRKWFSVDEHKRLEDVDIPGYMKMWQKAWSKFFNAYLVAQNKYFVFPGVSLTTNFSEAGVHGKTSSCLGQVNILMGPKQFNFRRFEDMVKYDIFGNNESIYEWLQMTKSSLFIDFWGTSSYKGQRYILSPYRYQYPVIKSFALSLRPIELNIREGIEGNGLYLYDTNSKSGNPKKVQKSLPLSYANYYLREFNNRLLLRYVSKRIWMSISRRLGL